MKVAIGVGHRKKSTEKSDIQIFLWIQIFRWISFFLLSLYQVGRVHSWSSSTNNHGLCMCVGVYAKVVTCLP